MECGAGDSLACVLVVPGIVYERLVTVAGKIQWREQWLCEGLHLLSEYLFKPARYTLSKRIRVSCGFPHTKAFASRGRVVGECWYPKKDNPYEIFISPLEANPVRVLDILTHEIVHTIAGPEAKHGKDFAYIAKRVGLTGKMTATVAGPKLEQLLQSMVLRLGDYPHSPLDPISKRRTPRGPNSIKAGCECGYYVRVPMQWADTPLPSCPLCLVPLQAG